MELYITFFIIITSIFLVPIILKRFNIPGITAIMLAGILIGPYGLGIVDIDEALKTFSTFGAIFLMFLAGMEVDNETLIRGFKRSLFISLFSAVICGIGGYYIGSLLGLDYLGALLYGIMFASNSVGIVYALLDELDMMRSKFGTILLGAVVLSEVLGMILLATVSKISLNQGLEGSVLFIIQILLYILGLLLLIPLITKKIFKRFEKLHCRKIHFVLLIILISILIGEYVGIHPMICAFITGVAVSEALTKEEHDILLNNNLNAIGYSFFIPIFFLTVGMNTNIRMLMNLDNLGILVSTVGGLMILKTLSGYLSFKIIGCDRLKSLYGGLLTIPQISAPLVVASVGRDLGVFPHSLFVTVVVMILITSIIAPIVIRYLVDRYPPTE
ncbi:potassium transporter [Methanofervidicoccus sp. A16]|uniref:cation:proton antiporter n=1 Tax=Methanofervidicoccus sp. A16 TaxID=2607662 RepID=UPI00118C0EEE|nr:cation:proton antiporter [Methanofervidicoccus sp. A16]AXI24911.1 potassium transporter [Methanofervidicoccus sp. A16]